MIHLFEQLLVSKDLTKSNVELLDAYVEKWGVRPFDALIETHLLSESLLADRMADLFQLTRIFSIEPQHIDEELLALIEFPLAKKLRVMPIKSESTEDPPTLVLVDPTHPEVELLQNSLPTMLIAVAEKTLVEEAILKFYPIEMQLPNLLGKRGDL